jgi:lantibiotic modifying enzyme
MRFKSAVTFAACAVFALSITSRADQGFTSDEKKTFHEYLERVADKIAKNAVKKETGIGWVTVNNEGKEQESIDFYGGNTGTCYFFLKAYAATHEAQHLATAKQCMAYILSQAKRDDAGLYFRDKQNGFFSGNAGQAYLFLYAYHLTKDKQYLKTAEEFTDRMVARPAIAPGSSPDIIGGAAGTGLYLLKIHEVTKKPEYLAAAVRLGDFLVQQAEPAEKGLTWKVTGPNITYYFVGFSHGPAGMGYYLDRLYRVTRNEKYRETADKAMEYIDSIAIREKDYVKWAHEKLHSPTRFSSQWCHGNPGMTPFFLELYEISKDKTYLDWARKNTAYILDQGVNVRKNGSVCHGISGNTAAVWMMYKATKDPKYFADVRDGIRQLEETVRKDPDGYYWEAPAAKVDYSYNLGLAGIGDFLVMLYTNGNLNMMGMLGFGDDL